MLQSIRARKEQFAVEFRNQNEQLNLWERYRQTEQLKSMPQEISLPVGEQCNIRCIFCTDRDPKHSPIDYAIIGFEDFRRFVHKLPLSSAADITLYGWGEPLVHGDYERMFDFISANWKNARIKISSNGLLLDEKWARKFLAYGRAHINFSLNAATAPTYRQLTGSNQFDKVVSHIRELSLLRTQYPDTKVTIALSLVAIRQVLPEISQFVNLAIELGADHVVIQDLLLLNNKVQPEDTPLFNYQLANQAFQEAAQLARRNGISFLVEVAGFYDMYCPPIHSFSYNNDTTSLRLDWSHLVGNECFDPWTQFMVSADGSVSTCCHTHSTIMGNIFRQSFDEIWNGEIYRYFRRTVNTTNPPSDCLQCPIKCRL
jgi:radical SAM protein with 4Fe4S-binding SPASM domain